MLNNLSSRPFHINADFPQGSILGPIFFFGFIIDLFIVISAQLSIYTDDRFDKRKLAVDPEYDLQAVVSWGKKWLGVFNAFQNETAVF